MNLVEIVGPESVLRGLLTVPGLSLAYHSATRLPDGHWSVSGTATDAAIAEIESRGAAVTIHQSQAEFEHHLLAVYNQIGNDEDDPGIGIA
jgi:hypothetical protein